MKVNDIIGIGTGLTALLLPALPSGGSNNAERPNFLFILLDDLAYDAIESSGRYTFLQTPNITRLQNEGVTFDNFFCTMSLSSPSRACLLTGVYPHMHGVNQNNTCIDPLWNVYPPYTQMLQNAGYESAFVGKMHNAELDGMEQIRPGFDYWFGFKGQGSYFNPKVNDNGHDYVAKDCYLTDLLTDKAVEWLKEKRRQDRNFSLCLWHKAVHMPFLAAPEDEGKYADEILPLPPNGNGVERYVGKPEWQKYKKTFDRIWENDPEWNPHFKQPLDIMETLLAVDRSVGRIYDVLEELGELDNTVIIFSSDNGYLMGEHGYWDKRIAYEESIRIPMIVRFPKLFAEGSHNTDICLNVDVAPTILEMAGIDVPDYMQGRSMLPLFNRTGDVEWRDSYLYEYFVDDAYPYAGPTMTAIRTDSFKLIDSDLKDDIDELYDLKNDPGEMFNLINNPEYDVIEGILRKKLDSLKCELRYNGDRDFHLRNVLGEKDASIGYTVRKIRYGAGIDNWLNLYLPVKQSGKSPVLVWAHPNSDGKSLPSADDIPVNIVKQATARGYAVISWESIPQIKKRSETEICRKDLESVFSWIESNASVHGFDVDNIFVSGASRGSVVSWEYINAHPEKIKAAYFVQALPKGAWSNPERTPLDCITESSPDVYLAYREDIDTSNGHSPKYGIRIADKYRKLGLKDKITVEYNLGESLYSGMFDFFELHID